MYNKKQALFLGFIIIGPGYKIFERIFPKTWFDENQLRNAVNHVCYMDYDEEKNTIKIFVGTTIYKTQIYPKSILHKAIPSDYEYETNKIQGFSERTLEFHATSITKEELNAFKNYVETNTITQQNAIKSIKKAYNSVNQKEFQTTKVEELFKATKKIRTSRNNLENWEYEKNSKEILTTNQKMTIYPESFSKITTEATFVELLEIEKTFTNKNIINFINEAKAMQKHLLLEQHQVKNAHITAEKVDNESID